MVGTARVPKELEARLEEIGRLDKNWNSYGAPPVAEHAIEKARSVLSRACGDDGLGFPAPFVAPGPHGGVGIEWRFGSGKELILDVDPDEPISYLLVLPALEGGEETEIEEVLVDDQELDELLQSLKE